MSFNTIDDLRNSRNIMMDFLSQYGDLGELWFPNDVLVISILNRANSINEAFIEFTTDSDDYNVAAFPLIRLQMDNLLYCYASTLVDDLMELMGCFVTGNNWNNFKDKDGNELKESYLIRKLCEKFGTTVFEKIYKRASDYIHLSTEYIGISLSKNGGEPVKTTIENYDASTYQQGLINMMILVNQALLSIFATDYSCLRHRSQEALQKLRLEHPTLSDMEILDRFGYSNSRFREVFYKRLRSKE